MKYKIILLLSIVFIVGCKKDEEEQPKSVAITYPTSSLDSIKIGSYTRYEFDAYGRPILLKLGNTVMTYSYQESQVISNDGSFSKTYSITNDGHLNDYNPRCSMKYQGNKLIEIKGGSDILLFEYNGNNLIKFTEIMNPDTNYYICKFYSDKSDKFCITFLNLLSIVPYPLFPLMGRFSDNLIKSTLKYNSKNELQEIMEYSYELDEQKNPIKIIKNKKDASSVLIQTDFMIIEYFYKK